MPPLEIRIEGIDKLKAKLNPVAYQNAMQVTMDGACRLLTKELKAYPKPYAKPKGEAAKHWTDKQRRWFWWAFKGGKNTRGQFKGALASLSGRTGGFLTLPYKRTMSLSKGWTHHVRNTGGGFVGEIGNIRPYVKFVQWGPDQAWIHQGRWDTVQEVVVRQTANVHALFELAIRRLTNR